MAHGAWKPGKGWPSAAAMQYLAAAVTVLAALLVLGRWYAERGAARWR